MLSKMSDEEVGEFLNYLRAKDATEVVFPGSSPRIEPADPDDDAVVHAAAVGRADALCALNRHFVSSEVRDYCRERGVLIANDLDLLDLLRSTR